MLPLSINNLSSFFKESEISFVRFADENNETISIWNQKKGDALPVLKNFLGKIKTTIYPDGVYYMFLKDTGQGKEKIVPIYKGTKPQVIPPTPLGTTTVTTVKKEIPTLLAETLTPTQTMYTAEQYFDLKNELVALQFENQRLNDLLAEFESMDEGEEINGLSEVKELIENVGLPLMDKYFAMKEQEIQLLSAKVYSENRTPQTAVHKNIRDAIQKPSVNRPQQQPTAPTQSTQGSVARPSFSPDGSPEAINNEEQKVVDELMSYDESELIDFYNANSNNGQGEQAYALIEAIRPEMMYIFNQA